MALGTASGQVVGDGGKVIPITLAGTVTAGDVYEGEAIGVYMESGVSGDVVGVLFGGHVTLTKATGFTLAIGDLVYWDATGDTITVTATDTPLGIAASVEATGAVLADVIMNVWGAIS